jgi:hypothetical protein
VFLYAKRPAQLTQRAYSRRLMHNYLLVVGIHDEKEAAAQ